MPYSWTFWPGVGLGGFIGCAFGIFVAVLASVQKEIEIESRIELSKPTKW